MQREEVAQGRATNIQVSLTLAACFGLEVRKESSLRKTCLGNFTAGSYAPEKLKLMRIYAVSPSWIKVKRCCRAVPFAQCIALAAKLRKSKW